MAYVEWSIFGTANFSPEELECAKNGGSWNRADQSCTLARPIPPAPPLVPLVPVGAQGTVDFQQMYDDGFVYVGGKWVKADSAEARAVGQPSGSPRPGSASVLPQFSSSVLGYDVPAASPVALPSFVGGLLGVVRIGGGMRPSSGGDPARVVMGDTNLFPRVRMAGDVRNWGR